MAGSPFLETVLRKRLSRFRKCIRDASARPGEKEIHDLRVSIRRLLAAFSVITSILRRKAYAAGTRRRLKSLMIPLGRLRDAQVKAFWLAKALPEGDEPSYQYALFVSNDLETWENRVRAALRKADPSRFDFVPEKKDLPDLPPPELRRIAASLFRRRQRDVESLRAKASMESDTESLHRMRLAFKRYRYCAELFAPLFPRVTEDTLERLHSFQTLLGDLHDFDVILKDARHFLASVIRFRGESAVVSRFRELRRENFRKLTPTLSHPDGFARAVFGDEFDPATPSGRRGSRSASSPAPSRGTVRRT